MTVVVVVVCVCGGGGTFLRNYFCFSIGTFGLVGHCLAHVLPACCADCLLCGHAIAHASSGAGGGAALEYSLGMPPPPISPKFIEWEATNFTEGQISVGHLWCTKCSVPDISQTTTNNDNTPLKHRPGGSNDPHNNQHKPQYANYWAPRTRKRHIPPHSAQPRQTSHWAPRTRKRPRKGTTTRRSVTRGGGDGTPTPCTSFAGPACRIVHPFLDACHRLLLLLWRPAL